MDIAIVGAGFCGVALGCELARRAAPGSRIILIGDADSFGRGVAYATPRPEHSLNVRARDLGIDPAQPAGFADWLALQGTARDGFQPRTRYGDYLCAMRDQATRQAAARGVELRSVAANVVAMTRQSEGFRLSLADAGALTAARVVLAIGALPPQPMQALSPALVASTHYIASPFADGALDRIDADAKVLVIGAGLTFVDMAISLRRNGHRGLVEAFSRHGLAPLAHRDVPAPPAILTLALQDALSAGDVRRVVRQVRDQVRQVDDWRCLIDALRPHTQAFWQAMDASQKARFLRHLRSYWEIHRHRIAPALMQELDAMRASGQLVIRAARLLRGQLQGSRVSVRLRDRAAHHDRVVQADVLIRATGLDSDVQRSPHALIAQLRQDGLICADRFGLGLETDAHFALLDAQRQPVPDVYVLGPLLRGRLWEVTAVPELRRCAVALAEQLCRNA